MPAITLRRRPSFPTSADPPALPGRAGSATSCRSRLPTSPRGRWSAWARPPFSQMARLRRGKIRYARLSLPTAANWVGSPMEPEAPWAVDQAIKSRTGNGAPAGLGTVMPDDGGHVIRLSQRTPRIWLWMPISSMCPTWRPHSPAHVRQAARSNHRRRPQYLDAASPGRVGRGPRRSRGCDPLAIGNHGPPYGRVS